MAGNALYDYARELCATSGLDWANGAAVFRAYLIDKDRSPGYTHATSHQFFSSIDNGGTGPRAAGPVALGGRTATGGACDANDITFTGVPAGSAIDAVVIIKFITNDGDSPLVAHIDTATGLPITPNGGDIIVTWDSGTNKIFRV